jgi:hypothetical protein
VYCVSFDHCVILCDLCCLCVVLIVVQLPPGENPFAVKINNNIKSTWNIIAKCGLLSFWRDAWDQTQFCSKCFSEINVQPRMTPPPPPLLMQTACCYTKNTCTVILSFGVHVWEIHHSFSLCTWEILHALVSHFILKGHAHITVLFQKLSSVGLLISQLLILWPGVFFCFSKLI